MRVMSDIQKLIDRYALVSDQVSKTEVEVILTELQGVIARQAHGDIVEFGCYIGTTSLFLSRYMRQSGKKLYVYDSFEGLPEKSVQDQSPAGAQFKAGELAASKADFVRQFKKAGLPLPVITKGWFRDVSSDRLPPEIAFAYLDGDYYESIRDSLRLVWPRLAGGSAVVVDDYANEALPGAARAVDEWLQNHPARLRVQASLAVLYPAV